MTSTRHAKLALALSSLFLASCTSLWEKDNTPAPTALQHYNHSAQVQQLWDNRVSYNMKHDNLKLTPTVTEDSVATVDPSGTVTLVDRYNGKTRWKPTLNVAASTGAAKSDDLMAVGTKNGVVIALSISAHREIWRANVSSEILATPVIADNLVIVKSIDGKITAFNAGDGHFVWSYLEVEPNLILRGSSTPQVVGNTLVIGYASGKVVRLSLKNGHELWSQAIAQPDGAFAIQRMIDIDANPVIVGNRVYVSSYQGKIAALDLNSGKVLWDNALSSYAGLTVDETKVYAADAKGHVYAFDRNNGRIVWKQTQLEARGLTGPALCNRYIVIGDAQGVLHWLNKEDGAFAARNFFGNSGLLANPVAYANNVYTLTQDGYLYAYTAR